MRLFSILCLLITCKFVSSQPSISKEVADSLWNVWSDEKQADTIRLKALDKYIWDGYLFSKPDSAIYYAQLEYDFAKGKSFKKGMSVALLKMGISFNTQGQYDKAIEHYSKGLKLAKAIGDKKITSYHLTNIGVSFEEQGQYDKAIEYYMSGLKIDEELGNKLGVGISLNNIGIVYIDLKMYPKAIQYLNKSMVICEEIDDEIGIASALNNLGIIYKEQENYDKALECQEKALKIQKEINDDRGMASSLNNIGIIEQIRGQNNKALVSHRSALAITTRVKDRRGQAISLNNIGEAYREKKEYLKAIDYNKKALQIAQEEGIMVEVSSASKSLFDSYKKLNQYDQALEMHELYLTTKDSLESEENKRTVIQQEYKYKYEKKAALDSLKYLEEQKLAKVASDRKDAEIEAKRNEQYALFGGLGLTLLFSGFMYNRFRITHQQKKIIEKQKDELDIQKKEAERQRQRVEEKNVEILNSIETAKRLRASILPPVKLVKQHFEDSFVIFKSKDIVNGNFYWMEAKEKVIMFAVAAYTGSSSSGAIVSVSFVSSLNKAVKELNKKDPADILNTAFKLMKKALSSADNKTREDMNITLCVLNETTGTLDWAGAKSPLWIVRHKENKLEEIQLENQAMNQKKLFYTQRLNVKGGDGVFMFSKGIVNNSKGINSEINLSDEIKRTLFDSRHKSILQQKKLLNQTFEKWSRGVNRIDDICMIGIRLPNKEDNPFTRREKEVLQLLDQGMSSKIIADEFNISKSTVDTHRKKMLKKVEVNSVTELLRVSRENNWI